MKSHSNVIIRKEDKEVLDALLKAKMMSYPDLFRDLKGIVKDLLAIGCTLDSIKFYGEGKA